MMILTERIGKLLDRLRGKRRAFQLCFGTPAGKAVLEDLAQFCHATKSCFDADPRVEAALLGRQEVWLRIVQHLDIPAEQLFALYYRAAPQGDDDV